VTAKAKDTKPKRGKPGRPPGPKSRVYTVRLPLELYRVARANSKALKAAVVEQLKEWGGPGR